MVSAVRWLVLAMIVTLVFTACGGEEENGGQTQGNRVNDHGTEDASGRSSISFELDDFYFEPTFLEGEAGRTITLEAFNEGDAAHTFTLEEQGIDEELRPGERARIRVTVPRSDSVEFFCRFHQQQGMRGALRVST